MTVPTIPILKITSTEVQAKLYLKPVKKQCFISHNIGFNKKKPKIAGYSKIYIYENKSKVRRCPKSYLKEEIRSLLYGIEEMLF